MPTADRDYVTVAPGVLRARRRVEPKLVPLAEAADMVSLTPRRLRTLVLRLGIRQIRLGHRTILYDPEEVVAALIAWCEQGGDLDRGRGSRDSG